MQRCILSLVSIKKADDGSYMIIDGKNSHYRQTRDILVALEAILVRLEPENFEEGTLTIKIERKKDE